jgi:peptide chain release factor 2
MQLSLQEGFLGSQRQSRQSSALFSSTAISRHAGPRRPYCKSSSSSVLYSSQTDTTAATAATTANDSSSGKLSQFAIESDLLDAKRDFVQASDLYRKNVQSAGVTLSILQGRIRDLEIEQAQPEFWNDANADRALHVNQQLSQSSRLLQRLTDWEQWHGDATAALEMLQASPTTVSSSLPSTADDHTEPATPSESVATMTTLSLSEQQMLLEEFQTAVSNLWSDCQTAELEWLLSGPYDACPACRLVLTAGAGGTEATDWVADLVRMYTRYIDEKKDSGWSCRILDETPGDVVGYKNVELLIQGPYAYGWCHGEKGAHRLVRLSPFNAKDKRQTTFAGVDVVPELQDTQAQVKLADIILADSDLEITTMRSGGKGGQNVNKVNSAVRIKHVPSGLSVKCTDERSQSQNKEIALMRLKTQLLLVAQEQRVQELKDIRGDMVEASWGSQIRNYVLHPYKQVKDPRTGWESNNAQGFLDGDAKLIDDCIGAYLRSKQKVQQDDADTDSASR